MNIQKYQKLPVCAKVRGVLDDSDEEEYISTTFTFFLIVTSLVEIVNKNEPS